jgi:Holliday junction resolvase-like predicted endonuclease
LDIVRYQRKGKEAVYWVKDEKVKNILNAIELFVKRTRKKKY